MSSKTESNTRNYNLEISVYDCLAKFREPLLNTIILSLNITAESKGLDAGCGTGSVTKLLADTIGNKVQIIGLDLSKEFIRYAGKNNQSGNLQFIEGDINSLQFDNNFFDWVWCMDTLWPGPKEYGCPAEDPMKIVHQLYRVLKPGGSLFLLFWSSQKLLPGFPLLEARLNTTSSASAPFTKGMNPQNHIMNAGFWLQEAGFKSKAIKTYTGDIKAPLNDNDSNALNIFFQMLWGESEKELDDKDRKEFLSLSDPESDKYILNNRSYYGFYNYTLFTGMK